MSSKIEIEQAAQIEKSPELLAIRAHESEILQSNLPCGLKQCPKCGALQGIADFRRHEIRKRTYLVILCDWVHAIRSMISRWKCSNCQKAFTVYPCFALPYKQYTRQDIFKRSQAYVQCPKLSYRKGVRPGGRFLYRFASERIDDRRLSHTSLYRWITRLGQLSDTLRKALEMIKRAKPSTGLFRELRLISIHPQKYRRIERKMKLLYCAQLGRTGECYTELFGRSIFPNLATACGWS